MASPLLLERVLMTTPKKKRKTPIIEYSGKVKLFMDPAQGTGGGQNFTCDIHAYIVK